MHSADNNKNNKFSVLIIDDKIVADSLLKLFDGNAYQICIANDSSESFTQVSIGFRPDIIISELHLRGKNGIDAINRIRHYIGKEIPAIIFTNDTSDEAMETARQNKCIFFRKP
jgi:CheY-like chemotaxis protein